MTGLLNKKKGVAFGALCGLLLQTGATHAQDVYSSGLSPAAAESTYGEADIPSGSAHSTRAGDILGVPKRFQYAFRLSLRGVYDDNIFLANTGGESDYYFAIEPGVTLGFGDVVGHDRNYLRFDYAPSIFLYVEHSAADAFQHVLLLDGQYHFGRLSLGLSQNVTIQEGTNPVQASTGSSQGPAVNLDTGGNTRVNTYTTNGTFSYDLTGKTFLSGGLNFTLSDYPTLIDSSTLTGNLFANYIYSPKLTVGLGSTGGYNWNGSNPNSLFEQLNVRISYQVSGKVSLNASCGIEFRQYTSGDAGNRISPVYDIGATYQPFDGTSINLSGSSQTQNSAALSGQNYISTTITIGARQRFLRRIYFGVIAGYENTNYFSTVETVDATRDDNYYFVQPAIDFTMTNFWTLGAYYLHRQDASSISTFSFRDNQLGLRTSLTF